VCPGGGQQAHGCHGVDQACHAKRINTTSGLSAGIDKVPRGAPAPQDDTHRGATGRTAGRPRELGLAQWWLIFAGGFLHDPPADGGEREGTARMEQAAVADFLKALGQDMLEEPADKFENVKVGGAEAGTAHFPIGERDRAVLETHDAVVGDGALEDVGGKGGEGRGAVMVGLRVDVPGDGPALRSDGLSQTGVAPRVFAECTGDGRESFDGDKAVGAGGAPGRAVLGETTAGHHVVDVGVVLEWPAPGVQHPGKPWEVGPAETRIGSEPFEGHGRGLEHGLGGETLGRAEEGPQGLRDGAGEEDVWPWQLCGQVVCEPLLSCMLLTLGTVAVATGMMDTVLSPTGGALREAMAIRAALALLEGRDGLAVRGGQGGRALQVCWCTSRDAIAPGRHGRSPGMRAFQRV